MEEKGITYETKFLDVSKSKLFTKTNLCKSSRSDHPPVKRTRCASPHH